MFRRNTKVEEESKVSNEDIDAKLDRYFRHILKENQRAKNDLVSMLVKMQTNEEEIQHLKEKLRKIKEEVEKPTLFQRLKNVLAEHTIGSIIGIILTLLIVLLI